MIVVDTSALMAVLEREPDADRFDATMNCGESLVMGAPTRFELGMVAVSRKQGNGLQVADGLLASYRIEIREWGADHADLAVRAFARFGKGRHPAALNFGDCMAYALARSLDAPLLYKGDDFSKTDIRSAL